MILNATFSFAEALDRIEKDASIPKATARAIKSSWMDLFSKAASWIETIPEGKAKARTIQSLVDAKIRAQRENVPEISSKIECAAGCVSCCGLSVSITSDEANVLASQSGIDMDKLKRQSTFTDTDWATRSFDERACVFLKDDKCSVYDSRPMSCRNALSTSRVGCESGTAARFVAIESDIIISAAFSRTKSGNLPSMVLEAAK